MRVMVFILYTVIYTLELGSTTRYSGEPEAAIISTTNWRQGETIKKLTAIRSYIDASEYNDFKLDDFR